MYLLQRKCKTLYIEFIPLKCQEVCESNYLVFMTVKLKVLMWDGLFIVLGGERVKIKKR